MAVADWVLFESISHIRPEEAKDIRRQIGVVPASDETTGRMQTSNQGQSMEGINRVDQQGWIVLC